MGRIVSTFVLALMLVPTTSRAQQDLWGVVDVSASFLREKPDYSAELGDQALMGAVVRVTGQESYWLKVVTHEPYNAWVVNGAVALMNRDDVHKYIESPKYIVTADNTHAYLERDPEGERVTDLVAGDLLLKVLDSKGKPVAKKGWVACMTPSGHSCWVSSKECEDFVSWKNSRKPDAYHIIATARQFLGVPYMWGGNSTKGVDCSGLTSAVFFQNGILLPRNSSQQANVGDEVDISEVRHGDFSALRPGDLLFFDNSRRGRVSHVAIYIGDGRIIHSSRQCVGIYSLRKGDKDYYENSVNLISARRVIGSEDSGKGVISVGKSPYYFPGNGALGVDNSPRAVSLRRTT